MLATNNNGSIVFNHNNDSFNVLITTERCKIRATEESDLMNHVALRQDPQVVAFNDDGQPKSAEWTTDFVLNKSQFEKGPYPGSYSVFKKEDGAFLGTFSLEPQDKQEEIAIDFCCIKNPSSALWHRDWINLKDKNDD